MLEFLEDENIGFEVIERTAFKDLGMLLYPQQFASFYYNIRKA